MTKKGNAPYAASVFAVATATFPDDADAVRLWLDGRTKADAERWTVAEARLYASVPLTARSAPRHRWTRWKRSGVLCGVESRHCLDCPVRQTRRPGAVTQRPSHIRGTDCKHQVPSWLPDGTHARNRADKRRGPATAHGVCALCGRRVTRTSPARRRASAGTR